MLSARELCYSEVGDCPLSSGAAVDQVLEPWSVVDSSVTEP